MFPPEIWRLILKDIDDPIELTRLQCVCPTWYKIIDDILTHYPKWQEMCTQDVPIFWQQNILKKKMTTATTNNPFSQLSNAVNVILHPNEWRDIYTSWKIFQRNAKYPKQIDVARVNNLLKVSESERITCITVDRNILAFATNMGLIYFCHIYNLIKPFYIAEHGGPLVAITFSIHFDIREHRRWDQCSRFLISNCEHARIKYWDFENRTELKFGRNLGQFVRSSGVGCFAMWRGLHFHYTWPSDVVHRGWRYKLPFPSNEEVIATNLVNTQMLTLNKENNKTTLYRFEHSILNAPILAELNEEQSLPDDFATSKLKQFIFLTDHLAVCIADNWLAFSVVDGAWTHYNMSCYLGGNVRALHEVDDGRRLIMGLDTGDIYIFDARIYWDWENYDFTEPAVVHCKIHNDPITYLDTHSGGTYILVGTETSIHHHKFDLNDGLYPASTESDEEDEDDDDEDEESDADL